jgi:hypothetical protein
LELHAPNGFQWLGEAVHALFWPQPHTLIRKDFI